MLPSSKRGVIALGAALALLATPGLSQAAPPLPSPGLSRALPLQTVTLITGDKVTAAVTADGHTTATVQNAAGRPAGAHIMTSGKDTYVYPDAALPYLASGVLDEHLFNVTELLADGYDDAHSKQLPLIVTYTDAAARKQAVPSGARRTLELSSIQGAALTADRSPAFWTSLTPSSKRVAGPAKLGGGIAKIWLDGKAKATLADTTAQIGAPEVWAGGDTGQGVDVAVLDTGIDAAHPDFGGRIAASQSFVPGLDITDRHGHGTHVASTIAGTGAASGGVERGVAPGANLHIGKVLDNDGSGQDSWILAGMEWAARDQHAKVISMSLGSGPTDGTDPMSQAVNRLSAETGALFVIAAGNDGPGPYSVSAPGAADAALTVGAVDSADRLAGFSSRGPRTGDNGLKPDLTAPGVDVLAARSQYAPEGEGSYLTMSGTSMATPHVAGAAALLARTHPDWTGQQLKDALVSTTKTTQQYSPFAAGSGRLDVAAAVRSTVFATGSAFSFATWPYPASQTVQKDVTYTNTGASAVTLDLALKTQGIPDGLFSLTAPSVTVPAGGTATVGVVSHLGAAVEDAGYSAVLTATGTDGVLRTHTPVGITKQSQRVKLTVKSSLPGVLIMKDIKRDTVPKAYEVDATGKLELSIQPSTYAAWLYADARGLDSPHSLSRVVLSDPEVVVDGDRTLTLDASKLRKVAATAPQQTVNSYVRVDQYRSYGDLHRFVDTYQLEPWIYDSLWVTPTRKVTQGSYTFASRWREVQSPLTVGSFDVNVQSWSPSLPAGTSAYPVVVAGNGSAADFAKVVARGKIAVVHRNDAVAPTEQAAAAFKAGAKLLLILNDGFGPLDAWADLPQEETPSLPVASLGTDRAQQLLDRIQRGGRVLVVTAHPQPEYLYDLVQHHDGAIPADPSYRPGPGELARIDESFRDTKQGDAVDIRYDLSADLTWAVGADATPVLAQGNYTAWVTAAPGVKWLTQTAVTDLMLFGSSTAYKPRSTTKETWFGGIQRPRLLADNAMSTPPSRVGDIISTFGMPGWGDGRHEGTVYGGITLNTSLYQGSQLVGEGADFVSAEVSPDKLPYRLVVDTTRDLPGRPYSPRTRTEWGFISDNADYRFLETLPLIQLDYGISTDLSGRASRRTDIAVTPSHLAGASGAGVINTVGLDVSYDDGAHWKALSLRHSGNDWIGRLDAPSKAGFVSLRVTARDKAGNSVSQTIDRAVGLR
ncbi:S8 family serine peptidase [Kribbella koreensis]|uniref:S8 family serine peptidase n=1 Tax=Kribbella koreensis TaxID=57909 RepID=A0ABN1RSP3_9ACTN